MNQVLVSEDDLRATLQPRRVDPVDFENAVRQRLAVKSEATRPEQTITSLSPALQYAAAILPAGIISQKQLATIAAGAAPAKGSKLLAYLAYPAVCFFLLIGATVLSVFKIRDIQAQSQPDSFDTKQLEARTSHWLISQYWAIAALFAATVAVMWYGATWLLFLGIIASFSVLIYVLKSLAKVGLGNRLVVGRSCGFGLMQLAGLGQIMAMRSQGIHFVDQFILIPIVWVGIIIIGSLVGIPPGTYYRGTNPGRQAYCLLILFVSGFSGWLLWPLIRPTTPQQIKDYVESFDEAPYSMVSWTHWGIVADWTVESGMKPDLTKPQKLLEKELAQKRPNFQILEVALRLGLLPADQAASLDDYEKRVDRLKRQSRIGDDIYWSSLLFNEWVIRTAVLRGDLDQQQLDYLARQIQRVLHSADTERFVKLESVLRATQLLAVVGKPVDPQQYRRQVHELLLRFHCTSGGGFKWGGGFRDYANSPVSSVTATAYAVELMQIYGVPEGLDLNWVRSFLKPSWKRWSHERWMLAVTRERFNQLSGVAPPTWGEILYYERTLLAATVLVGLCIYATLLSPKPRYTE